MVDRSATWRELVQAFRYHRRRPATAIAAVLVLTLGTAATTAVFSVIVALFFRPLPYRDADHLDLVWEDASRRGGSARTNVAAANFIDWRERNTVFRDMAAVRNVTRTLSDQSDPYSPLVHAVTANYFTVLGVEPLLGRTFARGEDVGEGAHVVILSFGLWQKRFAADAGVIGRTVALDGISYQIIGVIPASFYSVNVFPTQPELWIPLSLDASRRERGLRRYLVFARLRAGVTHAQAAAAMSSVAAGLAREFPLTNENWGVTVVPVREQLVGDIRRPMALITDGVGALFLIACFNFMSLLLASGAGRRKEMASRLALGAVPQRIFRQLLSETALLAIAGAAVGLILAGVFTPLITRLVPASAGVPFLETVHVDAAVATFAFASGIAVAVLCAFVTAHQAVRIGIEESIRHGTTVSPADALGRWARQTLVAAQVAISVVLLGSGSVMLQSLRNLTSFPLGFEPRNTVVVTSSLRGPRYEIPTSQTVFFREAARRLAALPGVLAVGAANAIPLGSAFEAMPFRVAGAISTVDASAEIAAVEPGYFDAIGIPIVQGRTITAEDMAQTQPVVVISETLARQHFERSDPVGRVLLLRQAVPMPRLIVGVARDVRSGSPDPRPSPVLYIPHTQLPIPDMTFVVRTRAPGTPPPTEIRRTVLSVDPMMPAYDLRTLDSIVAETDWLARFVAILLTIFTGVGLVLVGGGLYGILAFVVTERRREIGLRMALGATPWTVVSLIGNAAAKMVASGAILGIGAFVAVRRLMEPLVFGIAGGDWLVLSVTLLVLGTTTVVSCAFPLADALRTSPILALKTE